MGVLLGIKAELGSLGMGVGGQVLLPTDSCNGSSVEFSFDICF